MATADGFILTYSVIDQQSSEEINEFYKQCLRLKDCDKFPMVLVGNKCELESKRVISLTNGQRCAKKYGIPFMETQATIQRRRSLYHHVERSEKGKETN